MPISEESIKKERTRTPQGGHQLDDNIDHTSIGHSYNSISMTASGHIYHRASGWPDGWIMACCCTARSAWNEINSATLFFVRIGNAVLVASNSRMYHSVWKYRKRFDIHSRTKSYSVLRPLSMHMQARTQVRVMHPLCTCQVVIRQQQQYS